LRKSLPFALVLLSFVGLLPSFCFAQSEDTLASATTAVAPSGGAGLDASAVSGATAAAVPEPGALPQVSTEREPLVGIGVRLSTLGVGPEVAVRVLGRANVRAGFNLLGFGYNFNSSNGINYSGALHFRSAEAHFDYFLFRSLHISPGVLLYNGNNLTANAVLPPGQTFTAGGTQYESSSASPITANLTANFNKVAPEILVGIGNLVPRGNRHWSINADFGVDYEGAPKIAFGLTGVACLPPNTSGPFCVNAATDPTVQSNVAAQQATYNHDVSTKVYYRLWPVFSTGFSYSF
jgi:hypothetical protein